MQKETETEEKMAFCHIFIVGGISIGGPELPGSSPGYAYACTKMFKINKENQIYTV